MNKELNAINKWFFFSMNYPHDFIEKCWSNEPGLAEHFKKKFNMFYDIHGSDAVMNCFYASLGWSARKKFLSWVMENYNDEQKPNW